jgi:hypothetical protein
VREVGAQTDFLAVNLIGIQPDAALGVSAGSTCCSGEATGRLPAGDPIRNHPARIVTIGEGLLWLATAAARSRSACRFCWVLAGSGTAPEGDVSERAGRIAVIIRVRKLPSRVARHNGWVRLRVT